MTSDGGVLWNTEYTAMNGKTCKSLHMLSTIKAVWLARAVELQQKRRVHYLPLEDLKIPELRKAIFHALKLNRKWSGREDVDPQPVRCKQLNPILHAGLGNHLVENQAVTWVWFLEDGIHLTSVVDDTLVQLWNIESNTPILSFAVGGILIRASQYSDKEHFFFAGSIDAERTTDDGDINPTFSLWKYKWDTGGITNELTPATSHQLPIHPTSIFLTGAIAGVVYVTESPEEGLSVTTVDSLGYFNFLIIEGDEPYSSRRRYTPLSFFGTEHAELWKKEIVHCVRTASHFILVIESAAGPVEVYSYDWHIISDVFSPQMLPGADRTSAEKLLPRLKVIYEMEDKNAVEHNMRHSWTQPCLLSDGHRIGMLGYYVSLTTYRPVLTLSVLDLSIILAHDDHDRHDYHLHDVYKKRAVAHAKPGYASYTTSNNRFLGSQPRMTTSTLSAVERSEAPTELSGLSLSRFSPDPMEVRDNHQEQRSPSPLSDQHTVDAGTPSSASLSIEGNLEGETQAASEQPTPENQDTQALQPKEEALFIDMHGWFSSSERAEDIDLDDRLGRVAFGMENGIVIILEFV